ncbi:Tat pathway signal sequence domain protein [Actinoplanes sp. TBRC 11911]|uniref:LamG-like jellyroll fold domain-containing protein n=1 Tax=Actinoplanes sp. TBRC 11911 TaxID=2729386 RepID=UPI00145C8B0E|nr:LamG-like jellyroll fold domain-containing protein [Actinoplanes sp. TBRC 11911]NMO51517.1 Tat pathway signal sequence domain protein [Actinoplanes sp. TBRC 11911]
MERRNLLRAALAAPAVPLIGSPGQDAAADPASQRFTLAVLPDVQYLFDAGNADPAPLRATFAHLLERRGPENIVFLAQLGDLTEHGTADEMTLVGDAFRAVDGKLPYSVLTGNHDVDYTTDDGRGPTPYLGIFGPDRFRSAASFVGASADGYNSAHRFTAAGRPWLVLALDWRTSDGGLAWARGVLAQHRDVPTVVTTHDLAFSDDDGRAFLSRNGQRLWQQLIRDHDQVFLTLNGHDWPPGRVVLTNAAGHDVHVHSTNYQDRYYGGAAMIRLYRFDLMRDAIDVETYSPWLRSRPDPTPMEAENVELSTDVDRFSIAVDFERRFPAAPLPPPRPASALIDRDTVAYWRFDTPGQSVADGAGVRDQTGHGNDLFVRRLPGSSPAVLALTTDHHVGAPAHASLRFDGGLAPGRGGMLATGANAALNSMTFRDGYTIEAFVKLPEPFVGEHAWMGVFSWESRSGDAGKHSGWTTLEPTCSMNLAPDRFLQFVLYPADGDTNTTAWSHAIPTGEWQHLAVVGDGKHSVVWVNGSRIARNPRQPSRGIATTGRPFVLGATSFDFAYGQGFYGWIGDVRITARALPPSAFLPAGRFR